MTTEYHPDPEFVDLDYGDPYYNVYELLKSAVPQGNKSSPYFHYVCLDTPEMIVVLQYALKNELLDPLMDGKLAITDKGNQFRKQIEQSARSEIPSRRVTRFNKD